MFAKKRSTRNRCSQKLFNITTKPHHCVGNFGLLTAFSFLLGATSSLGGLEIFLSSSVSPSQSFSFHSPHLPFVSHSFHPPFHSFQDAPAHSSPVPLASLFFVSGRFFFCAVPLFLQLPFFTTFHLRSFIFT